MPPAAHKANIRLDNFLMEFLIKSVKEWPCFQRDMPHANTSVPVGKAVCLTVYPLATGASTEQVGSYFVSAWPPCPS
jgi:hypothetical protein